MQFFIGVVPPKEYKKRIITLQESYKQNVIEPHITVKAQSGLTEDLAWLSKVREVCHSFAPFEVKLGEPDFYARDVLFLSVEKKSIAKLHQQLLEAINPSFEMRKQYFEGNDYHPHLTLGQTKRGITSEELLIMKDEVERELTPYPSFQATFVRVYVQENIEQHYRKLIDFKLQGK